MGYEKEIERNRKFWEAVLGAEKCKNLEDDSTFEEERSYKSELHLLEKQYKNELSESDDWERYCLPGVFNRFYGFFGKLAVRYADIGKMPELKNAEKVILLNLCPSIFWIALRVLIQDIHKWKDNGLLYGKDSREEYKNYQERVLGKRGQIKRLCEEYPEMKRLIFTQIIFVVREIQQIVQAVKQDREALNLLFKNGKHFNGIEHIKCGQSDAHGNGQTVAEVYLDNQQILIYKPRNMQKDKIFLQLYGCFCKKLNLPIREISILQRENYSWQEYVCFGECKEEKEVERYFERMGVLLFLCYLTDAEDMHGENIIASGEYPVPIDLETVPGYRLYETRKNAETMVHDTVRHSVIKTGILPVPVWNGKGAGAVLNAINSGGKIQMPFKVPVLCDKESSDIRIEYKMIEKALSNSLPAISGNTVNPVSYIEYLKCGYYGAYMLFLQNRRLYIPVLKKLFVGKTRCLFRHTQQYHMYLQSSYYPQFLESTEKRRLFFHILDKDAISKHLLPYERDSLFQMNIPILYFQGGSKDLIDGNEREYSGYLECVPEENWSEKLKRCCLQDMQRQIAFIEYSMEQLDKRRYMHKKSEISGPEITDSTYEERIIKQIIAIADQLSSDVFILNNDIEFCVPYFKKSGVYQFGPAGLYFYYGLSGIAVFFAEVLKFEKCNLYKHIFDLIVRKLFCYTENFAARKDKPVKDSMGAFDGESSIILAYLLIYKITEESKYLTYAMLHADCVKNQWQTEKSMDYLSGLAGLVVVFCVLYRLVKQETYLDTAIMMGEQIWQNCTVMQKGVGWKIEKETDPLAGLAHGNSGLLMAYGKLLEETGSVTYYEKIDALLEYEDSLIKNGNWMDLRQSEGKRLCNNAWCHGATGILLSRLQLKKAGYPDNCDIVKRDIQYCRNIFLDSKEQEELCLCHGLSGNYMVLCYYLKYNTDPEIKEERDALGRRILTLLEQKQISSHEKYNPSLMSGISGVGVALCRAIDVS